MKETKLNKRLLRKVRNRIAKIPESYDQSWWVRKNEDAPCGTAACLAGEAIICAAPDVKTGLKRLWRVERDGDPGDRAAKLLGLSDDEQTRVFGFSRVYSSGDFAVNWPMPYAARFTKAKTARGRATIAVAYLDECLKRGKVTW